MTDESREPLVSDREQTDEGAREQGVRTEHPDDLSSPQMTSPGEDGEAGEPSPGRE